MIVHLKQRSLGLTFLVLALGLTACNTSKVTTYVNLAVDAVDGGLSLAKTFGAQISDTTVAKVSALGDDLKTAFQAWSAASADQKPGKWAAVQTALDAFKTYLPQVLNDAGVDPKYTAYAGIVSLAITAVEAAVNLIESQNPAVTGKKKAVAPLNVTEFKADYNQKMTAAGHPELDLK